MPGVGRGPDLGRGRPGAPGPRSPRATTAWEVLDPVDLGPIMDRRTGSLVGYKVDADAVDEVLATATADRRRDRDQKRTASPRRGYGALAHLLSADPATFPGARCAYATAVVATIDDELAAVAVEEWFEASPPLRRPRRGTRRRGRSPHGRDHRLVGEHVALDAGIGPEAARRPRDRSRAVEQRREAPRRDDPTDLGGERPATASGPSRSSDVDDKLRPRARRGRERRRRRRALTAAVEAVRSTLGTEVVSALDVTVGFSENDGDS